MDIGSLRYYFYRISLILFLFLTYQKYHDAHFLAPAPLFDMLRHAAIILLFLALIVLIFLRGFEMTTAYLKKRENAKFDDEEKIRLMKQEAKDSDGWKGGEGDGHDSPHVAPFN